MILLHLLQAPGYDLPGVIQPASVKCPVGFEGIPFAQEVCPPAAECLHLSIVPVGKEIDVGVKLEMLAHFVEDCAVELVGLWVWISGQPVCPFVCGPWNVLGLYHDVFPGCLALHVSDGAVDVWYFGPLLPSPSCGHGIGL